MSDLPKLPPLTNEAAVEVVCASYEDWVKGRDDLADLNDALAGMEKVYEQAPTDCFVRVMAACRRIEVRIGWLLARHPRPVEGILWKPEERTELRRMGAHPEIVEEVIADSHGDHLPTRQRVLAAIDSHERVVARRAGARSQAAMTRRVKVRRLLDEEPGIGTTEIARRLGVKVSVISNDLLALGVVTRNSKAAKAHRDSEIERMAGEGATSVQIAKALNVRPEHVGRIAKRKGIDIPGDRIMHRRSRVDPNRVIESFVDRLGAALNVLNVLEDRWDAVDGDQVPAWLEEAKAHRKDLDRFINRLSKQDTTKEQSQ